MINVFRSLLALSRFFKFHDGWDNLDAKAEVQRRTQIMQIRIAFFMANHLRFFRYSTI